MPLRLLNDLLNDIDLITHCLYLLINALLSLEMQNVCVSHIVVCSNFSNLFCVGSPDGIVLHLGRKNCHTNAFAGCVSVKDFFIII